MYEVPAVLEHSRAQIHIIIARSQLFLLDKIGMEVPHNLHVASRQGDLGYLGVKGACL